MATVAELNIVIGAHTKSLRASLKQAERDLIRFSGNMRQLGNELSLAVTLPLAAIGASAIQAAGEMESLRLAMRATFQGAGRSISEADAELENLRKSALAPGLDFEQAIKGSVRLQNVGYSAEAARKIIEQLANTVATTGGTADDLNEVVNQFSQMIGKGKLFQDDLKIITGRMPVVAQLMKEAFGTTTAEGINNLGIDARQFVDIITKKMAEMPRVQGGVANSIVNAWAAVRQSLATVGEAINKAFNVSGRLDQFANWVTSIASGFSNLSDTTKALILGVVAFAAALGPLVRVVGLVGSGLMAVRNGFISMQIAFKTIQGFGVIAWWQSLNAVMRANVIGVTITAVLALTAAFSLLSKDMSASAQAARAVEQVNVKAANAIAIEKVNAEQLIGVLKDENASRDEKKKALAALNAISPKYFGTLDTEKSKVADLDAALKNYTDSLLRTAKARAALEQIVELEKQRNEIIQNSEASYWQKVGNFIKSGGNAAAFASAEMQTLGNNFKETNAAIDAQIKSLTEVARANSDLTALIGGDGGGSGGGGGKTLNSALSDTKKKTDEATQGMTDLQVSMKDAYRRALQFSKAFSASQPGESNAGLPTVDDGLGSALDLGKSLTPSITGVNLALSETITLTDAVSKKWTALADQVETMAGGPFVQMQALLTGIGEALGPIGELAISAFSGMAVAAMEGAASMTELGKAAIGAFAKIAKMLIMEIALKAALKAVEKGSIFGALAAVGIAAALIGGLTALTKAIKVPAYAEGTSYAKGGLSLVGERGPELVNLPRGSQVIPNHVMRGMGGSNQLQGQFVLSRGDLILAVRSAAAQHFRETGKNPFDVR